MSAFHEPEAELAALRCVLEAPTLRDHPVAQELIAKHFDDEHRRFNGQAILDAIEWTDGERALIEVALGVWSGSGSGAKIGDVVAHVYERDYRHVLEALALRRGFLLELPSR